MSNLFAPSSTPATTLRIGQLSELTGRSIHTLRWHEAQGLIPGVIRDAGGRRQFSEQHVAWIALMDRLRRTGMSIAQMRQYTQLCASSPPVRAPRLPQRSRVRHACNRAGAARWHPSFVGETNV
jgi:DNA-binding transcriptional MerR regulator